MVPMLFLIVLVILLVTYHLWKKRDLPPGPFNLPVLGYLPFLDPKAPHITLTNLSKKYGPIFGLNLGSLYTVVLTDPKTIKKVFSKDAATGRAPLYLTHGIMQGYGLICAEGDLWKDQRRFVHNCLRFLGGTKIGNQREKMNKLILDQAVEFIKHMKSLGDVVEIDPLEDLRHSLGSAINLIVFGKSWDRDDGLWKWLQELQEEGTKLIGVAGPLNFLPFLRFIPKMRQSMDFLIKGKLKTHEVYKKLIREQQELVKNKKEPFDNLIQFFLMERERHQDREECKNFYNDQQFFHLLADIFGAGLDTTLTTIRWYLLYIATNKQIQTNIRTELKEVLENRAISTDDMNSLPLLESSILEVQRIRSVVPMGIPHGTLEELEIDGFKIPKRTMVVPLQWAIHMDKTVFSNPENFDPARFLDSNGEIRKIDNFMPFQTGKRMCVGDELAKMILFIFCATILQNFDISGGENSNLDFTGECGITLTPKYQKLNFKKIDLDH